MDHECSFLNASLCAVICVNETCQRLPVSEEKVEEKQIYNPPPHPTHTQRSQGAISNTLK